MDTQFKGKVITTIGLVFIGVGVLLVHKGSELQQVVDMKDYIDADFEIIE